jgi:hypothetical protein
LFVIAYAGVVDSRREFREKFWKRVSGMSEEDVTSEEERDGGLMPHCVADLKGMEKETKCLTLCGVTSSPAKATIGSNCFCGELSHSGAPGGYTKIMFSYYFQSRYCY